MKLYLCTINVLKLYAIGECEVYCVDSILVCSISILYIYIYIYIYILSDCGI